MIPILKRVDISFFDPIRQTFKSCASTEQSMWATVRTNITPWQQVQKKKEVSYKKEIEMDIRSHFLGMYYVAEETK